MADNSSKYQTKKGKSKRFRLLITGLVSLIVILIILKSTGVIGKDDILKVEVSKVEKRTIIETVTANGKLRPEKEVSISSDVSGEIIELNVKDGDKVKKGDLLARIKPDEYQSSLADAIAAYNSSLANLENAKATFTQTKALLIQSETQYKRYKALKEKNAISDIEFERIESEYLTAVAQNESAKQGVETAKYSIIRAKANQEKAQENLLKTSIFAPIDGIITVLNKELGERVVGTGLMEGTLILKLADLSKMEVNVDVNENDIINIEYGDTAVIDVDAFPEQKFKGIVTEIANSSKDGANISEQITTFEVKIRILESSYMKLIDTSKNVSTPFRPGMSAMVDIRTKVENGILCVPILAVTARNLKEELNKVEKKNKESQDLNETENFEDKEEVVFIFKDNKAIIQPVKIGIQDDYYIQITEGLEEGQEIISGPYNVVLKILKDGKIVNRKDENSINKYD